MAAILQRRIAVVFEYPTLNGGERSMLAVLDDVKTRGLEFVVIAPDIGMLADAVRSRGLELIPLRLRDEQDRRLPREVVCGYLRAAVEHSRADLVHANSLSIGRLTGAIAADLAMPCLAHLRDIMRVSKAAMADLNQNSRLLAVSAATRAFHCGQGLTEERSEVLYNGIDTEQFQPRATTNRLKREHGIAPDAMLVATIGQIGMRKGQDVLAAAAKQLADETPAIHYLLIGERNSTKQENIDFERALLEQFPAGRLHRLGYRSDVNSLLGEIDLLVHPARQEPFGRVLLEAAAAGVPIVATNVGGTAEMLEEGQSATLVPPDDPTALSHAIKQLLHNEERRKQQSSRARERIVSRFSIEVAAARLGEVWREVLDE